MKAEAPDGHPDAGLLAAVVEALSVLLEPGNFEEAMQEALRLIGEAAGADRIYVFENHSSADGHDLLMSQRYEWVSSGIAPQFDNPGAQNLSYSNFPRLLSAFRLHNPYRKTAPQFTELEQRVLGPQGIRSFACTPIFLRGELWGVIGIDDCTREREWTEGQMLALRAAAVGLGGAIVRRNALSRIEANADELKRQRSVALSLMEDARRAEQAAAEANGAKSMFLAMMSHDIRTPLNGVIGFTDLLLADSLSEQQSEVVRTIRSCGETLLGIVSDILDISHIESGRMKLEPTEGNPLECMQSMAASFEPLAREHHVELRINWEGPPPPSLKLDFNRFRQILLNLIGNAVKFTRNGLVEITAHLTPLEGLRSRLSCEVKDTGAGIEPRDLAVIFEPFEQGTRARTMATGGSGLGLAICRRLVELMGGEIRAGSQPGQGSQFTFHIIVDEVAGTHSPASPPKMEPPSNGSSLPQPRILVVDDMPVNIRLVTSLLERIGLTAGFATNGDDALEALRKDAYDLVFMDVLMPEPDGIETTLRARDYEASGNHPAPWIVALTADVLVENRRKCIEAGMNDFLTKPVRLSDIESCIERWRRRESKT